MNRTEQGSDLVIDYYTRLRKLWDELDDYVEVTQCTCATAGERAKEREVEKLYQFLIELDADIYAHTCSQILNVDPLPNVNKAFSIVSQEESRRAASMRDSRVEGALIGYPEWALNRRDNGQDRSGQKSKGRVFHGSSSGQNWQKPQQVH
ncbi:hypothetical protein CRG98_016000 [Punica granatum]|uniref:Retrotransposon gag domain-containing protein n=1 Tax=Punica granatum TaxID=22663 RepID=A0A2I0K4Z1_PUNGR|nr:hypothetical protein CRG98_016000 [Punica granatum]